MVYYSSVGGVGEAADIHLEALARRGPLYVIPSQPYGRIQPTWACASCAGRAYILLGPAKGIGP